MLLKILILLIILINMTNGQNNDIPYAIPINEHCNDELSENMKYQIKVLFNNELAGLTDELRYKIRIIINRVFNEQLIIVNEHVLSEVKRSNPFVQLEQKKIDLEKIRIEFEKEKEKIKESQYDQRRVEMVEKYRIENTIDNFLTTDKNGHIYFNNNFKTPLSLLEKHIKDRYNDYNIQFELKKTENKGWVFNSFTDILMVIVREKSKL